MLQYRDITLVPFDSQSYLAVACDSSAGVGEKPGDCIQSDARLVAAMCLRVPLLELLCIGAQPVMIVDTLGNEMFPTGEQMIQGIKAELAASPFSDLPLNGSTEENFLTQSTSIGVTVIGKCSTLPSPQLKAGALLWLLGEPLVGAEVLEHLDSIVDYACVQELFSQPGVLDMLPVGSKGIQYEAGEMGKPHHLYVRFEDTEVDLVKSGGPSTSLLIAAEPEVDLSTVPQVRFLGRFVN
ncbi:hypothetical protein IGI37_003255 [Enterococcus sp. AZ194]|uniref:hypothetical protein n=1 Tax=Enterococcus sp. AZ194 TaxID=2774629 RepID=UPI003F1F64FB